MESWQIQWGKLDEKWIKDFLNHDAISQILYYPNSWIQISLLHNKKLSDILNYLQSHENEIEPKEYIPHSIETDEQINNLTRSIGKQSTTKIPENDWWREPQ